MKTNHIHTYIIQIRKSFSYLCVEHFYNFCIETLSRTIRIDQERDADIT